MADGAGVGEHQVAVPAENPLAALFSSRNGLLKVMAATNFILLAATVLLNFSPLWGVNLIAEPYLNSWDAWIWLGAASCFFWLPLLLLLLDKPDNMATGPGLALPIATLTLLCALNRPGFVGGPTL